MSQGALALLLLTAVGALDAKDSYFVTFPQRFNRGSNVDVSIDILKDGVTVPVEVSLVDAVLNRDTDKFDVIPLQRTTGNFSKGVTGKLSLPIKPDVICDNCKITVRGLGALQFEESADVVMQRDPTSILIQTDKAIYKPSQTVQYRVLAFDPSLKLYKGKFNIEIIDPGANIVKVVQGLDASFGVVQGSFDLSDQPHFGTWLLTASIESSTLQIQRFEVAEYDLPLFEVTVELPPYSLVDDAVLTGKVKAKYTFGQPVSGMVELHVGKNVLMQPETCGETAALTTQISFEVNGETSFTIPKEDITRTVYVGEGSKVSVTAFVTETTTGIRLNGSSVVKYYRNKFEVKFLDKTPNVFKPGLPYTAFIQVSSPDKMPPTEGNNFIHVYTYVKYSKMLPDQDLYATISFAGTYPLPGQNLTLPASGLLPIEIDIPKNATEIKIKATFGSDSAIKSVRKTYSKSQNYIQLSLLDKNIRSGDDARLKVVGTEPLPGLTYEVLSRGSVVNSGRVEGNGKKELTFTLKVTASMAPTAHVVVYYDRNSDEIVADSLAFNVDGLFDNKVSIAFSANETQPGQNVDVVLTADPESQVHILAIDQSVLLLKTGNDITPDKVKNALSVFDASKVPMDSESALSTSETTVTELFENLGLVVLTDLTLATREPGILKDTEYQLRSNNKGPPLKPQLPGMADFTPRPEILQDAPMADVTKQAQEVESVRFAFPESWLWASSVTSSNGKAILKSKVPDTITSWVVSAFATNVVTGLGVAPTTSMLRVFKSFFVSLHYPTSVVRNEKFVVQATVFNYLREDLTVKVTLKNQAGFKGVKIAQNRSESLVTGNQDVVVIVKSDTQSVAYFPILATSVGLVDIEVTAQTTVAADGVRRQILVKPEGAPVSYNVPVFINNQNTSSQKFEKKVSYTLPASVVEGSEKARVKVTGDLIGLSLSSLTSLITLPTGCGEQVMVKFAPQLYIAQYLKATGQMTDTLKRTIVHALEAGYQRQLRYQRGDGGYSPFGNYDQSSSTWLTALTFRVLSEAQDYIYVDPALLQRSVTWIVNRQNIDGSFNQFGKILDRNTQGTDAGPSLTAFVLLSLLEAKDLFVKPCHESFDCYDFYLLGNATKAAKANLENLVASNAVEEQFSLAVVSYALSKAKSPLAKRAFDKLLTFSKTEGNILYWQANSSDTDAPHERYAIWRPPRIQAQPNDILITSYAILTFTELGRVNDALPAVRWLTTQRNAQGGFSSTQDTVVGLQALSAYATKSLRPNTQLNIQVSGPSVLAAFNVTRDNALSLQIKQLPGAPKDVVITATGSGIALVDIDYTFNVNAELATPSFDVSTVLLYDKVDAFNLMICTKRLLKPETGMVVQEISIPSGFKPDLSTLGNVAGLKRSERQGDVVAIYFDKIGSASLCYSLRMVRESKVAQAQRSYVRTFGYHEPDDQSTVFYQPKAIRDATLCDVCGGCCPRG